MVSAPDQSDFTSISEPETLPRNLAGSTKMEIARRCRERFPPPISPPRSRALWMQVEATAHRRRDRGERHLEARALEVFHAHPDALDHPVQQSGVPRDVVGERSR